MAPPDRSTVSASLVDDFPAELARSICEFALRCKVMTLNPPSFLCGYQHRNDCGRKVAKTSPASDQFGVLQAGHCKRRRRQTIVDWPTNQPALPFVTAWRRCILHTIQTESSPQTPTDKVVIRAMLCISNGALRRSAKAPRRQACKSRIAPIRLCGKPNRMNSIESALAGEILRLEFDWLAVRGAAGGAVPGLLIASQYLRAG